MLNRKMNHKFSFNTRNGFTLAEILVTLVIIGIVAALTIPSLVHDLQKQQYVTSLKKAYRELSHATNLIIDDNNGTMIGLVPDSDTLLNNYCTRLNCVKKCMVGSGAGQCWHNANQWYNIQGTSINDSGTVSTSRAVLSNGMLILVQGGGSTFDPSCSVDFGFGNSICTIIRIDVNGFNKPNANGRDIFYFWALQNGLTPRGTRGDWWTNDCDAVNPPVNGYSCAGRVLLDGDMNY